MLGKITQKSQNTLENQGDKSLEKGQSEERTLFDQFSEILDKIATSLNRSGQDTQNLNDLATSLSQAASQQQVQRPVQTERRAPVEQNSRAAEVSSREFGQAIAKEDLAPQVARSENGEQGGVEQKPQEQQSPNTEKQAVAPDHGQSDSKPVEGREVAEVIKAGVTDSPVDGPVSEVQEIVAQDLKVVAETVSSQKPVVEAASQDQQVSEELVVEPDVETSVSAEEIPVRQLNQASQKSEIEQLAEVTPAQTAPVVQEVAVEPQAGEQSTALSAPSAAEKTAPPEASDFTNAAEIPAAKEIDMRQLLLQSAQALINQALLLAPSKQAIEASTAQKLFNPIQMAQGNGQSNAFGPASASPMLQNKSGQSASERTSARELSRPAALRTMERVESALKEVARSKDGKTISLRLDPPSLGSVKIDVTIKDGQLHARIVAESAQVNALLREQSHELQQILRRVGIQADGVTVSVGGESQVDVNQSFQSFDQQGAQQFSDSSGLSGGFRAGVEHGVENTSAATKVVQPVDHWVA